MACETMWLCSLLNYRSNKLYSVTSAFLIRGSTVEFLNFLMIYMYSAIKPLG
jgi:hypothetical protein